MQRHEGANHCAPSHQYARVKTTSARLAQHEDEQSVEQRGACRWTLLIVSVVGATLLIGRHAAATQRVIAGDRDDIPVIPTELDQIFLFLLGSLGPLNVIAPFATMTRGREDAFKRRLALQGAGIAAVALFIAATLGAQILRNWGVSTEALLLTGGIVLFLVALRQVLLQYAPHAAPAADPEASTASASTWSLTFSPLVFPTIVTPFGIAVLVVALRLRPGDLAMGEILGLTAVVLVLDLLAMLFADRIMQARIVYPALFILGSVMVVLQVALGVEVMLYALRLLGAI